MKRRIWKLRVLFLILVLGVLMLIAAPTSAVLAAEKIRLGICQSTAPGPAKFAVAMWKGAELVVEDVNARGGIGGRKLELVSMDIGKNDPSLARLSMQKAISFDKIVSLLCWGSNVMLQNGPLIDESKVLAFTMSQSTRVPRESKYTQQLDVVTTLQVRPVAEYVKRRFPEIKKVGVLYVDYEFGYDLLKSCEAEFGKRGMRIVAKASHPIAPADLRAQFTRLLDAAPDAIYVGNIGGGELSLAIRTARELGFKGLLMTHTGGDAPDLFTLTLTEKDYIFVGHLVPDDAPSAVKHLATTQHGYASSGYDFAWVNQTLATELVKEGKDITGENLLTKLRKLRRVRTPVNEYEFLSDGITFRSLGVFDVKQGNRRLLLAFSPEDLK